MRYLQVYKVSPSLLLQSIYLKHTMLFDKFTFWAFIVTGAILFLAQNALGKHQYDLVITRMEKAKTDPKWFQMKGLKVNKFNGTCTTIKGKIEVMQDIPADKTFEVTMIASNSVGGGQYKRSAVGFGPTPGCEFFEKDEFAFPSLAEKSNLERKCPLKKGFIEIYDWDVNTAKLVDTLPQPNDWKIELILTIKKKEVIKLTAYGKIIRTIGL